MLPIARHKYRANDHSYFIFAMLVAALLAVSGFIAASSDSDADTEDGVQTGSKSATAHLPQATPTITITVTNRIVFINETDDPNRPFRIFSVEPDGTNLFTYTTVLTGPTLSDLSPDGTLIVYTDQRNIAVMNADGTNDHIVSTESRFGYYVDFPAVSPDKSKIAYGLDDPYEHSRNIFVMNLDGSNKVHLTTAPHDYNPDWSPDGSKLVFHRTASFDSILMIMNANGSNQHPVYTDVGSIDNPKWSPDGTQIAFTGYPSLMLINPDGSNLRPIPNTLYANGPTTWSPDGQAIAACCTCCSQVDLFRVNLDGSDFYTITHTPNRTEYSPSWGGPVLSKVLVKSEDGLPMAGAQVFHNCDLVGTTNVSGTVQLTSAVSLGDTLIARAAVYTGTTQKLSHDGWAYQVWLTNILENNDGTETPYVVTDTSRITHTLKLLPTNARIGFNIVASYEYNTSDEQLAQVKTGFMEASERLMDATDGQMFFERVTLYEDSQHFNDADFQFTTDNVRANADLEPDGISALTGPTDHIRMYGPDDYGVPYDQFSAYSTLVHEFGHYALGASDEYYKWNPDDYATSCTLDLNGANFDYAASLMDKHESTSEFCSTISPDVHNPDTAQGYLHGESVWETIVDNWSSDDDLWELRSPMTRGTVDKGPVPNFLTCPVTLGTEVNIVTVPGAACAPIGITADYSNGDPAVGAGITVKHNGNYYSRGTIGSAGIGTVVGAEVGDTVMVGDVLDGIGYNASFVLTQCHGIGLVLTATLPQAKDLVFANNEPTAGEWPAHWLTAVPNWSNHHVDLTLQFAANPPTTPALYATQGSGSRQAVTLTYNAGQHQYTGIYTFSGSISPDFQFDVEMPITGGVNVAVHKFLAGQFHNTGPNGYEKMKNLGAPHGNDPSVAPVAWGLLRPESMADVIVNPTSLPDGTGVMVGKAGLPADAPTNLIAVGGPYSVQGQNAINGEVGITLEYISEHYCGLQPGTPSIYRYTGTGWVAIPTTLIDEWHQAGSKISQWGIYGVFAQPNAQTTFSDVPAGSTFYDYINWITCHEIASGYSDGTFRPNNNATRGQISKMMSLTYQWHLDPPTNGYTFADVLPGSTFFLFVEAAYREGVVSGYACGGAGEPCDSANRPYFRPSNNVTRGQIAKIVSNGSKFTDTITGQQFEDVPAGSTFYDFVSRMASRQIINGYACGGPGEPCGSGNKPYFRPSANATRGQLSKMIYLAAQPR